MGGGTLPSLVGLREDALAQRRADLTEQHMTTVAFVDYAASEAHRLHQS